MMCKKTFQQLIVFLSVIVFVITAISPSFAQVYSWASLPEAGVLLSSTNQTNSISLKGITINKRDPFNLDFIIDLGNKADINSEQVSAEAARFIRYFLTALTLPEDDMWVNLSPYEAQRIVSEEFGVTEMGRDLLAQDYLLKQMMSSLLYPESDSGNKFWKKVYQKAYEVFGTTDVPFNTFNKVWIIPTKAVVYEHENKAYVVEKYLTVMLEKDYLATEKNKGADTYGNLYKETQASDVTAEAVRRIILPILEQEVNQGESFTVLRQAFDSMILATWYKTALKDSILSKQYADHRSVVGIDFNNPGNNQKIYQQYVKAFKQGVFDYIKEEYDDFSEEMIPRKYFAGGIRAADRAMINTVNKVSAEQMRTLQSSRVVNVTAGLLQPRVAKASLPIFDLRNAAGETYSEFIARFNLTDSDIKLPIFRQNSKLVIFENFKAGDMKRYLEENMQTVNNILEEHDFTDIGIRQMKEYLNNYLMMYWDLDVNELVEKLSYLKYNFSINWLGLMSEFFPDNGDVLDQKLRFVLMYEVLRHWYGYAEYNFNNQSEKLEISGEELAFVEGLSDFAHDVSNLLVAFSYFTDMEMPGYSIVGTEFGKSIVKSLTRIQILVEDFYDKVLRSEISPSDVILEFNNLKSQFAQIKLEIDEIKKDDLYQINEYSSEIKSVLEAVFVNIHSIDVMLNSAGTAQLGLTSYNIFYKFFKLPSEFRNSVKEISIEINDNNVSSHNISHIGDVVKIESALRNLIKNSFEAVRINTGMLENGKMGKIILSAMEKQDLDLGKIAVLEIKDNGGGIPEEVLQSILDESSSKAVTTKGNKGNGIGTKSAIKMIKLHGGRVSIDVNRTSGETTFSLTIPLTEEGIKAGRTINGINDNAMTKSGEKDALGGIDFDSRQMRLNIERDSLDSSIQFNLESFSNEEIIGLTPVIINITPINSLPMYLGFSQNLSDQDLS